MFDARKYIISSTGLGPVYQRVDGFRDRLPDTGVRAARVTMGLMGAGGAVTTAIVTSANGILAAQDVVAALWPKTEIDIIDYNEFSRSGQPLVGGETGFAASDYLIKLGKGDRFYCFHPVAILLSQYSQGAALKEYLIAAMQKIAPGMYADVVQD